MQSARKQYVGLAVLFIVAVICQVRFSLEIVRDLFYATEVVRVPLWTGPAGPEITEDLPEAREAGARRGDLLLSVNGRPFTGLAVLHVPIARARPGEGLNLVVRMPSTIGQAPDGPSRFVSARSKSPRRPSGNGCLRW